MAENIIISIVKALLSYFFFGYALAFMLKWLLNNSGKMPKDFSKKFFKIAIIIFLSMLMIYMIGTIIMFAKNGEDFIKYITFLIPLGTILGLFRTLQKIKNL